MATRNVVEYIIKGVDQFSKPLGKVGKTLTSVTKIAAKFAAAGTAAAAGVFGMANSVTAAQAQVQKFSDRIGTTADQLSSMQYAAERSGVAANSLNMGLQRMTRRVAEAASGTGEAVGALNELNISAASFQRLPLNEQMGVLADRLNGVANQGDRVRLAFKLFDSEGVAMLQMLQNGSAGMRALAADAEFLGIVISEKAGRNAEAFQDQLTRVRKAFKGLGYAMSEDVIPIFTGAMKHMANWIAANRENIVNFINKAIEYFLTFVNALGQVADRIGELVTFSGKAWEQLLVGVMRMVTAALKAFALFGKFLLQAIWEGVKGATNILNDFGAWIGKKLASIFEDNVPDPGSLGEALAQSVNQNVNAMLNNVLDGLYGLKTDFSDIGGELGQGFSEAFGINIGDANEKAQAQIQALVDFGQAAKDVAAPIIEETSNMAMAAGQNLKDQFDTLSEAMLDRLATWRENAGSIWAEMADMIMTSIEGFANGVGQAFAQTIVYGKSLSKALGALAKQILASIIQTLIKIALQRTILSAVNKSLVTAEASAEGAKAVGLAGANMFASMAAAPFPINLTAPAMAAAAMAGTASIFAAGQATGAALGASIGGQFDDGINYVPRSGTYLLEGGERVIKTGQNRDLTEFLEGETTGNGMTVENLNIVVEGVQDADSFVAMDAADWRRIVAGPIYDAMSTLSRKGVRPEFT